MARAPRPSSILRQFSTKTFAQSQLPLFAGKIIPYIASPFVIYKPIFPILILRPTGQFMSTSLNSGTYSAHDANLAGSEFHKVNLSNAKYLDVNLRDTVFENIALTRSKIRNACLGDVSIEDANYTGMRIEGILVTELLRVYRETHLPDAKQA
jgi:hypothetical protein